MVIVGRGVGWLVRFRPRLRSESAEHGGRDGDGDSVGTRIARLLLVLLLFLRLRRLLNDFAPLRPHVLLSRASLAATR